MVYNSHERSSADFLITLAQNLLVDKTAALI